MPVLMPVLVAMPVLVIMAVVIVAAMALTVAIGVGPGGLVVIVIVIVSVVGACHREGSGPSVGIGRSSYRIKIFIDANILH